MFLFELATIKACCVPLFRREGLSLALHSKPIFPIAVAAFSVALVRGEGDQQFFKMAAAALALQRHAASLVLRPMAMPSMAAASEVAQMRTVTCCALPRNPNGYSVMEEGKRQEGNDAELMGRGDKRTRKGKIFAGSFGNTRPKNGKKRGGISFTPLPPMPPKKDDAE